MRRETRVFSAFTAQDRGELLQNGQAAALLCWRIGENGRLQRAGTPAASRGGLLGLVGADGLPQSDVCRTAQQLLQECRQLGFRGVLLDFSVPPEKMAKAGALCRALRSAGLQVFAPEALAGECDFVVVPAAVSGGSFSDLLEAFCSRYGAERLCIDPVRVCSVFDMPAASPEGETLPPQALARLLQTHGGKPFFSPELCTQCFTFTERERVRFALFDDAFSREKKLQCIREKGIAAAILLRREWSDEQRLPLGRTSR